MTVGRAKELASWAELAAEASEFAEVIQGRLSASEHHVLATLRADGSPRVNGTNLLFEGEDLVIGCMPGTRRAADLRRDPRCAIHTAPDLASMPDGDARIECEAQELSRESVRVILDRLQAEAKSSSETAEDGSAPSEGEFFSLQIKSVSHVQVQGDRLLITSWDPAQGLRKIWRS